jgi:methionyl aminopeptidase
MSSLREAHRRGFEMEETEEYDYNVLKEVGKASYDALNYGRGLVKEGAKLIDIAEGVESYLKGKGFELAFPVNVSINENAAHYTSPFGDMSTVPNGAVVKLDVGARKGTYLGDCATTIDLSGRYAKLVEAAEKALENAISMVKAGRKVNEIGREMEKMAKSYGFEPIRNLGGHGVERHDLHAGVFIPNFDNGDTTELEEGQVIAIEPFMTNGSGYVGDGETIEIFQKTGFPSIRAGGTREIAAFIDGHYLTFPFASRWIQKELKLESDFGIRKALTELAYADALESFPVLVEKKKGIVAQAEKEMIVEKDSCTVVTI